MIDLDKLTSIEQKAIEELQLRLQNELPPKAYQDTFLFIRFLRARNLNVDKAENMLRKHLLWRKSFQVDTIRENFNPEECFRKYIEPTHLGYDKEGDMIQYSAAGRISGRDIHKCMKMNEFERHWIWFTEEILNSGKLLKENTKKKFCQMVIIINLDELTLRNVTYKYSTELWLRLARVLIDNCPECLKSVYVINAPRYYVVTFAVLKLLMSRELLQKINIFGRDGWKEKLLEVIDADVLPAFLGGNRTDPDGNPLCNTFVSHAGRIPETYHIPNEKRWFKNAAQVKKILIYPKEKNTIPVDVTESKSLIEWEFLINHKDIGFGLLFKDAESEVIEDVLPVHRYDTVDGTEVGRYKAEFAGSYIIVFDNSHSWMTSKEVEYCITVS